MAKTCGQKYSWANVLTKYAIVFWNNDEATVIDIGVFGLLMTIKFLSDQINYLKIIEIDASDG
jgi:hypothetical protein